MDEEIINNKKWRAFEAQDPFNPGNIVTGYIHMTGHLSYGMLYITHVNGEECEQKIWATPKLSYPFGYSEDGEREYKWPDFTKILSTTKLDGTNVCAFKYSDAKGKKYVSYKTRRTPFMGDDFIDLWNECLGMWNIVVPDGMNLSFEMWGYKNPHLIKYDTPLEATLLFGIKPMGLIVPADMIDVDCPKVGGELTEGDDLNELYESDEEEMEEDLEVTDEYIIGDEGHVWYLLDDDGHAVMMKVKPKSVRDVHWNPLRNSGIPNHCIASTVINSFEETDVPDADLICELLAEEFEEWMIEKSRHRIEKVLAGILVKRKFKKQIIEEYREHGFDIYKDKRTCMRWFGQKYGGKAGADIYNILVSL